LAAEVVTAKWSAAAPTTLTEADPVTPLGASVAVTFQVPAVKRVAPEGKVCRPASLVWNV
jgi:hypothetical protein